MSVDVERTADHMMRNMRRAPAEWEGMLSFAGEQLSDGPLTDGRVYAVYGMVNRLPNEELEACRYYGAGQFLCKLGQNLMDPAVQQTIVEESGDKVAENKLNFALTAWGGMRRRFARPPRFYLRDLQDDTFGRGFFQPIRDAAGALPADTRLLTDTLAAASVMRRLNKADSPLSPYTLAGIRRGVEAADFIHKDVLVGTLTSYQLAYRAQNKLRQWRNPAVTASELGNMDIRAVSAELASLHIDTLVARAYGSRIRNPVIKTATGDLRVMPDVMQEKPRVITEYDPKRQVIHAEKLSCPALQVIGMLPLVGSMVPSILERAENKVAAEWAERR